MPSSRLQRNNVQKRRLEFSYHGAMPNPKPPTEHAIYHNAEELGGIELLCARYRQQNFSRHTHAGYTVGVIESGAQQFYRTGGNHIAPQYSIILVNADQVHTGCSASQGGWSYKAIYPLPEQFIALNTELGRPSIGAPYFPSAVVHDTPMARLLLDCFAVLQQSDNPLQRESALSIALVQLMQRHGQTAPSITAPSLAKPGLSRAKEFLDDQAEASISLEDLALIANLSPYHFLRQFKRCYELTPHAYQVQARLRKAKDLIKQGWGLFDTALQCGFHDQSHLHRHFKAAMGTTPGQFAKQLTF